MDTFDPIKRKDLVLIFAYAPAGLGHLRVSNALHDGLPEGIQSVLLGSQDKAISLIHRIVSIHPLTRSLMEWVESGLAEDIFVYFYRRLLRSTESAALYRQLVRILEQRVTLPKTVLIVATHFGLAHQLAVIKDKLAAEKGVKAILIVQVTDDTPLHVWYVDGADIIFVPSEKTKEKLKEYGKKAKLEKVKIEQLAYPISPNLACQLGQDQFEERSRQVNPIKHGDIHVAIPVSGAAIATKFFTRLLQTLHKKSPSFIFHVISKTSPYTKSFLEQMKKLPYTRLYLSDQDREIIDQYETMYQSNVISLEATKPSEQAFKALLNPQQIGGSLLLFSEPIGKQERDNLDFLYRHHLIPSRSDQEFLFGLVKKNLDLGTEKGKKIFEQASFWRGLMLPKGSQQAADFIWWTMNNGLFNQMMLYHHPRVDSQYDPEVNQFGVSEFWKRVVKLLPKAD